MSWFHPSTLLDKVFEGSLLFKGLEAVGELLAGFLLLFVSPESIHKFITFVTQQALSNGGSNAFSNFLIHSANSLNVSHVGFLIVYLWIHAAIKLVAVVGLLRNLAWAYPFSFVSLGLLVIYQVYSIVERKSIGMVILTIFDLFVLWLIWREYKKQQLPKATSDQTKN
jgi:uncharacterized membrane protein